MALLMMRPLPTKMMLIIALIYYTSTSCQAVKLDWWNKLNQNTAESSITPLRQVYKPVLTPVMPGPNGLSGDASIGSRVYIAKPQLVVVTNPSPSPAAGTSNTARQTFKLSELRGQFDQNQTASSSSASTPKAKIIPAIIKRTAAVSRVEALLDSYASKLAQESNTVTKLNQPITYFEAQPSSLLKSSNKVYWDDQPIVSHLEFPKQKLVDGQTTTQTPWYPEPTTESGLFRAALSNQYPINRPAPRISSRFGQLRDATTTVKPTPLIESYDSRLSISRSASRSSSYDDSDQDVETTTGFSSSRNFDFSREREDEDESGALRDQDSDSYQDRSGQQKQKLQRKTDYNAAAIAAIKAPAPIRSTPAAPVSRQGRLRYTERLTINHDVPPSPAPATSGRLAEREGKTNNQPAKQIKAPPAKIQQQKQDQTDSKSWTNAKVESYFNWQDQSTSDGDADSESGRLRSGYSDSDSEQLNSQSYDDDQQTGAIKSAKVTGSTAYGGSNAAIKSSKQQQPRAPTKSAISYEDNSASLRSRSSAGSDYDSSSAPQRSSKTSSQQSQSTSSSYEDNFSSSRQQQRKGASQSQDRGYGQRQRQAPQRRTTSRPSTTQSYATSGKLRQTTYPADTTTTAAPRIVDSERLRAKYEEQIAEIRDKSYSDDEESNSQLRDSGYSDDRSGATSAEAEEEDTTSSGIERESLEADPWSDNAPLKDDQLGQINQDDYNRASQVAAKHTATAFQQRAGKQTKSAKQEQKPLYSFSQTIDHSNQQQQRLQQERLTDTTPSRYEEKSSLRMTTARYDDDDFATTTVDSARLQKKTGWSSSSLQQTTEPPAKLVQQDNYSSQPLRKTTISDAVVEQLQQQREPLAQQLKEFGQIKEDNYEQQVQQFDNEPAPLKKRTGDNYGQRETEVLNNIQQNYEQRSGQLQEDVESVGEGEDHSCRLQDSIPGEPEQDYPTLTEIPVTDFNCADHEFNGYYADVTARCQVFHVCQADGRKDSFLCPVGTTFNQQLLTCDWWANSRCEDAPSFYDVNADLYVQPPPTNNLLRRKGTGAGTKGGQDYSAEQQSADIEQEDNYAPAKKRSDKLQIEQQTEQLREKEGVYFDNQVTTSAAIKSSPQRATTGSYSSSGALKQTTKPAARVRQTTYGARVRATVKASQLRDEDNWASASQEDSRSTSSFSKDFVTFSTASLTTTTTPLPTTTRSTSSTKKITATMTTTIKPSSLIKQ